jgi:hypothetical protein
MAVSRRNDDQVDVRVHLVPRIMAAPVTRSSYRAFVQEPKKASVPC